MSYTDRHGQTVSFDLGGGPDSWESLGVRIIDNEGLHLTVDIPLAEAVKLLAEGAAETAAALAARIPRLDPLRRGGQVTNILHTAEGLSWNLTADRDIVWETRLGWQIQWSDTTGLWGVTRPAGRVQHLTMQALDDRVGPDHYPILGITVTTAPRTIHDGQLGTLPKDDAYVYETARGMQIRWDGDRAQFGVTSADGQFTGFWGAAELPEAIPPNQYPIHRKN